MKKKLMFAAYSLDIGGIEKALITLINYLVEKNYMITLVLEKKQGILLDDISDKVKIIEYTPNHSKNRLFAKIKNGINRLKFIMKYKNKYDCAISYATYSLSSSFIAKVASKNSVLWVHSEYLSIYENDEDKYKQFFRRLNYQKFKKIVFVSNSSRENFEKIIGYNKDNKLMTINNLINYEEIITKSRESVSDIKKSNICTFLFVGRLSEHDKKISRLLEASKILKEEQMKFRILIIGEGRNTKDYKNYVNKNNLDQEIIFLGNKKNPYPYFLISDCLILTSEYEGFPVVYIEAMLLGLPIITTNVSDSKDVIDKKYGIVTEKNIDSICMAMKKIMKNSFKITERFDAEEFNKKIIDKVESIISG